MKPDKPAAADTAARAEPVAAPSGPRWVVFDAPGVKAIGKYRPRVPVQVAATEAARLVAHKGFRYTDAPAAADAVKER